MVCLSHAGTIKLVDRISVDYDVEVQFWSDELLSTLKVRSEVIIVMLVLSVVIIS